MESAFQFPVQKKYLFLFFWNVLGSSWLWILVGEYGVCTSSGMFGASFRFCIPIKISDFIFMHVLF